MLSELVEISTLSLDPVNSRKHNKKNLEAIKGSLARFGQQKPIVISKDNIVIAGNGTVEAAKALGWDKIEVKRSGLTGSDITAFAIADNRTGELAEWDDDVLGKTLSALKAENFNLDSIGFSDEDLNKLLGIENGKKEKEISTDIEYLLVIECRDEIEQTDLFQELQDRSFKCKIM